MTGWPGLASENTALHAPRNLNEPVRLQAICLYVKVKGQLAVQPVRAKQRGYANFSADAVFGLANIICYNHWKPVFYMMRYSTLLSF